MGTRSECKLVATKSDFEPGGSSEDGSWRQISGEWLSDALTTFSAFTLSLGPGTAINFYFVTVGYYQNMFKTRLFFIAMMLATYGPFPLVTTSQAVFDACFDKVFTTHATYPFRIFVGTLMIQMIVIMWMCLPATEGVVIGIGVALGVCCCVVQGSGHQMISAIDPTKLSFMEMGGQIGSVVPIVMIPALHFKPSATAKEFREFIVTVIIVNFSAMVMLLSLHVRGFFYKAYARLAYDPDTDLSDLREDSKEVARRRQMSECAADTRLLDEPIEASYKAASRQLTPAAPERESSPQEHSPKESGIPSWAYLWQITKGHTTALMAFIVSLAGFYGDPAHTQFLASAKLASDFLGRASSLPLVRSEYFGTGPWHRFLVATVVARVIMAAVMLAELWSPVLPRPIFISMWCLFAILDRMVATLSDVTCGAFVEVKDRKFVSRLTFFAGYGGVISGLAAAALLEVSMASRVDESGAALLGIDGPGPTWDLHPVGLHHHGLAGGLSEGRAFRTAASHFALRPR